jgi:plastocyanin
MVIAGVDADAAHEPGVDPFTGEVETEGEVGHGHLPENDNHGGEETDQIPDPSTLPDGPEIDTVMIEDYLYEFGDFSEGETDIPRVRAGQSITFDNSPDAPLENGIWHTITSCALPPCNRSTGIAYPLADGDVQFDSGQLGTGGPPTAERVTWDTPSDLQPGTYSYFCRVHPFMRGAFRVIE